MFGREPVAIAAVVRQGLLVLMAFGIGLTMEQTVAIQGLVEVVLALLTRQSVTPNQNVRDNFVKVPAVLLATAIGLGSLSGCAKAPPDLTPEAKRAFYATQVVKDLDRLREVAVAAHATTPPILTAEETQSVVKWHLGAITSIKAGVSGWQAGVSVGLDALLSSLSPRARSTLAPYVAIVKTLLQEIR